MVSSSNTGERDHSLASRGLSQCNWYRICNSRRSYGDSSPLKRTQSICGNLDYPLPSDHGRLSETLIRPIAERIEVLPSGVFLDLAGHVDDSASSGIDFLDDASAVLSLRRVVPVCEPYPTYLPRADRLSHPPILPAAWERPSKSFRPSGYVLPEGPARLSTAASSPPMP